MGRMKELYMQLLEEGKLRDPSLPDYNDDEYWKNRDYWQQVAQENQEEDDDD